MRGVVLIAFVVGCNGAPAKTDATAPEVGVVRDGGDEAAAPESVDFVVQGCPKWVEGACQAEAPLKLTFAVVSAGLTGEADWDFGDNETARGRVVSHVYDKPGSYDVGVTLVIGLSIPLTLLAVAGYLFFTGDSLNILTMTGMTLAVGMVVDNSVVVLELSE